MVPTTPDVIQESSPVEAVEQQSPAAEGQTQQEVVSSEPQSQEQGQAQVEQTQPEEVNWKNRAMEYERKLRETVEILPTIIREEVSKVKTEPQPKQPEYAEADLRAFIDTTDDVNNKRWAYAELSRLEKESIANTVRELNRAEREAAERDMLKKQTEQKVVSDPRFQDAFVDVNGTKQWNYNSELTRKANAYMQDRALASRPDALEIAMKLAYADVATNRAGAVQKKLEGTKVENIKLKQHTLVEGAGINNVQTKPDPISDAQMELSKTGSKKALRTLTNAVIKQQGII